MASVPIHVRQIQAKDALAAFVAPVHAYLRVQEVRLRNDGKERNVYRSLHAKAHYLQLEWKLAFVAHALKSV